jgi:hypothetical protein
MSDTSIKKRIEKLLRLAESSNPHEAELATKKAEALMVQWGIEAAELDAKGEISEKVVEIHRYYTTNSRAWAPFVHSVCVGLGNLKALKLKMGGSKVRMYLIGHESDVDRAQMLLNSLEIQAERALAAWWSGYPDKAWIPQGQWYKAKHQFLMSFGEEVRRRLAAQRVEQVQERGTGTELVLVNREQKVNDWMHQNHNVRRGRGIDGSMHGGAAGRAAGARANLGNNGIGSRGAIRG